MKLPLRHPIALALAFAAAPLHLAAAKTLRVPAEHRTIQIAIDASESGDRVVVSEGRYRERITLKPGISLVSEGGSEKGERGLLRAERTIIDAAGDGGESPGVTMAEASSLDGFTVTGVGVFDAEIWQKDWDERGENQKHEHIGGFGMPGIGVDGVSCRVQNCIVHHNGHTGIAVRGSEDGSSHPIVTNNVCFRNMGGGIGLMRHAGGIVQGNRCFENLYAGIGHSDGAAPLVVGNECFRNVRAGIGVSEGSCPVVRDNHCHHNRRAGIGVRTGAKTRPVIEANLCEHNDMAGIGSDEGAEPILRGNRCQKNAMAGIGAQGAAKPLLVGNECVENAAAGIGLRPGCAAILWRNICTANKLVAVGLPENARAIIVENTLSRTGGMPPLVAIKGGSEAILVGNKMQGGGVAGVLLDGRAVLADNQMRGEAGRSRNGIWLWKGARALAAENRVIDFRSPSSLSPDAEWIGERPEAAK